ncbi:MAG: hypothetical protein ACK4G5_12050 [Devosia sp.]
MSIIEVFAIPKPDCAHSSKQRLGSMAKRRCADECPATLKASRGLLVNTTPERGLLFGCLRGHLFDRYIYAIH